MARAKKTAMPPQRAEDIELAKQTITSAFTATVEERCAEVAKARAEVRRLEQLAAADAGRLAAWIDDGTIDEESAQAAHSFAHRASFDLLKGVYTLATLARVDRVDRDAALRQANVTERWLTDRNLLPAELVKSRPNR